VRHLVQRPLPGELLTSALIRTCRRAGLSIGAVTRVLSNGRKWTPGFFQASQLTDLAEHIRMQPIELLWKHSVFPYVTAFYDPGLFQRVLASALTTGTTASCVGPVTQSASDQVRFRRFCGRCALEDERHWGESYWRREHNLPGVLVCLKHRSALRRTKLRTSGAGAWSYLLPMEVSGAPVLRGRPSLVDLEVAERSVALLHRPMHEVGRDPAWYRQQLLDRNLISPERQISRRLLIAWARSRLGSRISLLGLAKKQQNLEWLALMVRPRETIPFIALKHVIFESLISREGRGDASLNYVPSGPSRRSTLALDRESAARFREIVRSHVRTGTKLRICDAMTQVGCWAQFRHDRARFPRLRDALQEFRLSDACLRPLEVGR